MQTDYLTVKPLMEKIPNEIKSALIVRVIVGHGCSRSGRGLCKTLGVRID